ncbi:MAG: hydratase [Fusobacterium perfoetens]|uniref:hydratase n=1 Tax=Fusobacterium perfoetens TaxID=852 RepID=UPI0023EFA2C4|nr:hydratase [Fusobacterium perfoetens]MCI6152627.1 hydratase [Fusobacterium perfoetens]MDY3237634.1 hydratase [Fusobacterium perfoetens]
MVKLYESGIYLLNGKEIVTESNISKEEAKKGTIAYSILKSHNKNEDMKNLKMKFDAMASHDITFVGIIQTAKASGMKKFPIPYVLTNCHNSLCAVGGTINEDDHMFGLSAAKKYGGIYVPPHIAVIHQFMREKFAGCGKMILGSDSHTRYGALGTIAIGEGGGELVKQLLKQTYDIAYPEVIAVYLDGKAKPWVGPQDIALAIIGAVFKKGYVKNKIVEFVGPGVSTMTTDFRNGIDVMTTETACLSSIWRTDEDTREFLKLHGREDEYKELNPKDVAYYDGCVYIDLNTVKPMIALPFHPSNVYEIDELNKNPYEILKKVEEEAESLTGKRILSLTDKIVDGKIMVQQGIIAGCAGGNYTNLVEAVNYLEGKSCGNGEFSLSVYPSSQPVFTDLLKKGVITDLTNSGVIIRTAFCGPCFGAGDTPTNNGLSIRHTTRNFPNREGSKPGVGQMSAVALMDARSIAATAANGGILTSAETLYKEHNISDYNYDETSYKNRVYYGFNKGNYEEELKYGPNIKDWPEMDKLSDNILLKVCSKIMDPVTTTDELIPSGETSSYRSNPLGLAEFTLSRRDPNYVTKAKNVRKLEDERKNNTEDKELIEVVKKINKIPGEGEITLKDIQIGSTIYAVKPGDGSAREQAASCQRVLGALANICEEYATKRYRSNLINWGMLPFQMKESPVFDVDDYIYIPNIKEMLKGDMKEIPAYVLGNDIQEIILYISNLTETEKEIIKAGCLINFNRK